MPTDFLTTPAFTPDGKTLAVANHNTIHLLNPVTGTEIRRCGGDTVQAATLAFSPDGQLLAAGTEEGGIRLWETATGTLVGRCEGHRNAVHALAFAPDGKTLVSGGADTTGLVWDYLNLIEEQRAKEMSLTHKQLTQLWHDLGSEDAAVADRVIQQLTASPGNTLPFLNEKLRPADVVDAPTISRWIDDLDGNQFAVREKAMGELERVGKTAESALRQTLTRPQLSLELRRRVEQLVAKLEGPVQSPDALRPLRALEILEQIGTAEARQILTHLSRGPVTADLTQQAHSALTRLGRK